MEVFADTFIPPGLEAWFSTRGCPVCLRGRLERLTSLGEMHWLCGSCGHCFRAEHGVLRLTDPLGCQGCTARSKTECIELLLRDFPRFSAGAATDA